MSHDPSTDARRPAPRQPIPQQPIPEQPIPEQPGLDPVVAFAELGRFVLGEQPLDTVLQRIADLAKTTIQGASDVSITLMQRNRPHTVVFTGEVAAALDERQYDVGYGPCLDAAISGHTVTVDHNGTNNRYPGLSEAARATGIKHSVSVGLPVAERVIGGMNVYGSDQLPFDTASTELAHTFASYAAVAIANAHLYSTTAELAENQRRAMESRAVIEQAKGVVMFRDRCTADDAFATLTRESQQSNRKLRDVAADLVADVATDPTS